MAEVPVCREAGLARRDFGRQSGGVKDRERHVGERYGLRLGTGMIM
jgi:hypothetical protein